MFPNLSLYGPLIVIATPIASHLIHLGSNANALHAPGIPQAFPLKFRAFIPPAWINGPDTCVSTVYPNFLTGTIYGGDNRNFNPFSSSFRLAVDGIVSNGTYAVASPPGVAPYRAGTTYRYSSNALAPDGFTLLQDTVLHDCYELDNVVQESWYDQQLAVTGLSPGVVTANMYGSGSDLAAITGSLSPSIDYNFTITLNSNQNQATVAYTHDCYPAYELYVSNTLIYGRLPPVNSPTYLSFCLAGFNQVSGITTVSLP